MSTAITRVEEYLATYSSQTAPPDKHDLRLVLELAKAAVTQMDNEAPVPPGAG